MNGATQQLLYLYCLTGVERLDVRGPGLDETDCIFSQTSGNVAAVLSRVSAEDFCGRAGEQNLQDPGWVCERAMRHQRVVEQVSRQGPVLPARFGTLFSTTGVLAQFVKINQETIVGFLDTVRDHEEWGIKAQLERAKAKRWLAAGIAKTTDIDALSPGLRYVREKRAQAAAEKELHQWVANCCDSVAQEMSEYVSDLRQRKIIDDRVAGESHETVLNIAVLISRDRLQDWLARFREINTHRTIQGLSFVLSGPWPPYSFCPSLDTRQ